MTSIQRQQRRRRWRRAIKRRLEQLEDRTMLAVDFGVIPVPPDRFTFTWDYANLGDIDGDLIDDIAASLGDASDNRIIVFSGHDGAIIHDINAGEAFFDPQGVAAGGDFDADGYIDIVTTRDTESPNDVTAAGSVYTFSGKDGSLLFRIDGEREHQRLGIHFLAGEDLNNDGTPDIIATSNWINGQNQRGIIAFSGNDQSVLYQRPTPIFFPGGGGTGDHINFIGDIDHDGTRDFAVAINVFDTSNPEPVVQIYSGFNGDLLKEFPSVDTKNLGPFPSVGDTFGFSINATGDFDGDGFADLLIGDPLGGVDISNAQKPFGSLYVLSGKDGSLLTRFNAPTTHEDGIGFRTAVLDDVTGDGVPEFVTTSIQGAFPPLSQNNLLVFDGANGSVLLHIDDSSELPLNPFSFTTLTTATHLLGSTTSNIVLASFENEDIVVVNLPRADINVLSAQLTDVTTVEYAYEITGDVNGFDVTLHRSADRELSSDDELLDSDTVHVTASQGEGQLTFTGTHIPEKPYLLVAVDSDLDTDESNNVKAHLPALTIITHGFQLLGDAPFLDPFPQWVTDMGRAVNKRLGHQCTDNEIENSRIIRQVVEQRRDADGDADGDAAFDPPLDGCDHLLLFDWTDLSNNRGTADNDNVAGILTDLVRRRVEDGTKPFVHFIGHSRGAFVNRSTIERLGQEGGDEMIEFLHMTVLDHQPYNTVFGDDDGQMNRPPNVDYADNYYQNVGGIDVVFEGEPINGVVNVNITDALTVFNTDHPEELDEHSEVRAWYHWTIDTALDAADANPDREYEHVPYPNPDRATIFPEAAWVNGENVGFSWAVGSEEFASRPVVLEGSPVDKVFVEITTGEGASASVEIVDAPATPPNDVDFPVGHFQVDVQGLPNHGTAILTIYVPPDQVVNSFYKYGPTPENTEPHWYSFDYDETTKTGAVVEEGVITVYYVDGQRGDDDLEPNGRIFDPGAPALIHVALENGDVVVIGTSENDHIHFHEQPNGEVTVHFNRQRFGPFTLDDKGRFVARGLDGNDLISVLGRSTRPAEFYGEGGNDVITGGSGDDLLNGGEGRDVIFGRLGDDIVLGGDEVDWLFGGRGRDLVIGGLGQDHLFGGHHDDLLISGVTVFDDKNPALAAIQAEWTSSRSYFDRVENLRGTGAGITFDNRLNGTVFLIKEGDDPTVFDDQDRDWLFGNRHLDWFILHEDEDRFPDRRRAEAVN